MKVSCTNGRTSADHLFIGCKKGIVVLTKCDLVDDEWLTLVEEEVREALKGTVLENAPFVPVSSTTGKGLDKLIAELDNLAQSIEERSHDGIFRMPIDRVFTVQGHGTVVTGTMISGTLKVGDEVVVYPRCLALGYAPYKFTESPWKLLMQVNVLL